MTKKIYFDMDGTVADLYGSERWLEKLRNEEEGAFIKLEPMVDMNRLGEVVGKLMMQGWQFGIITWLPMDASEEYEEVCTREKRIWAEQYMPWAMNEFYAQRYGTPKQDAPVRRAGHMILVDDNAEVRAMWETAKQRKTIDAKCKDIITELEGLVE